MIKNNTYLVLIPRYKEFTEIITRIASKNVTFISIAGNNEIFLTAIAPIDSKIDLHKNNLLFDMKILTNKNFKRIGIKTDIKELHTLIKYLTDNNIKVEHIYDY